MAGTRGRSFRPEERRGPYESKEVPPMADPSVGSRTDPGRASTVLASAGGLTSNRVKAVDDMAELHDGPDYVDEWMEQNLSPSLVEFVRSCCTSFLRWDLLRQLQLSGEGAAAVKLATAIGTSPAAAATELENLASLGMVIRRSRGSHCVYQLRRDTERGQALQAALDTFAENREFRFAVVYSIVRASHRSAELE